MVCSTVRGMSAAVVREAVEDTALPDLPAAAGEDAPGAGADDVTVRLGEVLDWLHSLVSVRGVDQGLVSDAARIDRIGLCERLQAGLEAVKAVEMVAFAQSQTVEQLRLGVHPRQPHRRDHHPHRPPLPQPTTPTTVIRTPEDS